MDDMVPPPIDSRAVFGIFPKKRIECFKDLMVLVGGFFQIDSPIDSRGSGSGWMTRAG